jgi:S-DNA-T family DNA segregation ATPase FtsK/SpoIIIE
MARRGRRKLLRLKLRTDTVYSIASILFFLSAFLVILSFSHQGRVLGLLFNFLLGLFSWCIIFIPFILIICGLLLTRLSIRLTKPNILVGSLLIFVSLVGLSKAGKAGLETWLSLKSLLTWVGAFLILVGALAMGIIVFFETSIDEIASYIITLIQKAKTFFPSSRRVPINLQGQTLQLNKEKSKQEEKKVSEKEEGKKTGLLKEELLSSVEGTQLKVWEYPSLSLLTSQIGGKADRGNVNKNAATIEKTLDSFGIQAKVIEVNGGPAVTQYCLEIALGTKLSKITALSNDLALALAAPTGQIRIEAPIPGRSLVGIEIPNRSAEFVTLKQMLTSQAMKKSKSKLTVSLGLNVAGEPVVADIGRMPHILIAGATGSGKSVCINAFIGSFLFRASPAEVKLILVDPKRVELTQYNGIPHLLTPVITDPEQVVSALKWAIGEMERRYKLFAEVGVRNIEGFNDMSGFQALPYLVIIIDELADIMLFAPSEVEDTITRLAQMARATGIHLIISTQRPSVDVLTGLIKANIPARIAFNVSSMIDSRVILDTPGAEKLLGRGDMLFIPPDQAKPTRIQGAYVSDQEINQLITFLRQTGIKPVYTEEITTKYKAKGIKGGVGAPEERDPLFGEAVKIICQHDRASASLLQRRLSIGYSRAARILDQLEAAGAVSAAEGSKPRDVIINNAEEFLANN